ncbi:hypothetical protein K7432_012063, partial [Basidiobolus ranarum]
FFKMKISSFLASVTLALISRGGTWSQGVNASNANSSTPNGASKLKVGVVLFEKFTVLDAAGPLQVMAILPDKFDIQYVAEIEGHIYQSDTPGFAIQSQYSFANAPKFDILLVPGGPSVMVLAKKPGYPEKLRQVADAAVRILTVCTGSGLLASTGILDGKRATTNKNAFKRIQPLGPNVNWVYEGRWVDDGKFTSTAGVSAGIDGTLHVIEDIIGTNRTQRAAEFIEYEWQTDPSLEPFSDIFRGDKGLRGLP